MPTVWPTPGRPVTKFWLFSFLEYSKVCLFAVDSCILDGLSACTNSLSYTVLIREHFSLDPGLGPMTESRGWRFIALILLGSFLPQFVWCAPCSRRGQHVNNDNTNTKELPMNSQHSLKLGIMTVIATVVFSFGAFAHAGLPQTQLLKRSLHIAEIESAVLSKRLKTTEKRLGQAQTIMSIPARVSSTLNKINRTVATTLKVITPLQAIPKVGAAVKPIVRSLSLIQKQVRPATVYASRIAKAVHPSLVKLKRLRRRVRKVRRSVDTYYSLVRTTHHLTAKAERCTYRTSNRMLKARMQWSLETYARITRPNVERANAALRAVNGAASETERALSRATRALAFIRPIEKRLYKMQPALGQVDRVFGQLRRVLRHKITFAYPHKVRIPVKVKTKVRIKKWYKWSVKVKVSTRWKNVVKVKKFKFSVDQILKGVNSGIGFVNKQLKKLADKVLRPVLKKLKIKFPSLPGLGQLRRKARSVQRQFGSLYRTLSRFEKSLKTLQARIHTVSPQLKKTPSACR